MPTPEQEAAELLATPVGFAFGVLGLQPHPWQCEVLSWFEPSLRKQVMVTLCSPNGAGKDAIIIATVALWWVSVHKRGRVVITAADSRQIDEQTYPGIARHQGKFAGWTFLKRRIETTTGGSIILYTTDDPGRSEGFHKDTDTKGVADPDGPLLIIANEAKSIPDAIFTGIDRCTFNALLYTSSPGHMLGRFYESHLHAARLGFKAMQVGLAQCPHIPPEKIDRINAKYGPDSQEAGSILHGRFMLVDGEVKFDKEGLRHLQDMAAEGYTRGQVGVLEAAGPTQRPIFIPDPKGWVWMDEPPTPGLGYMMTCDPNKCEQSEGSTRRDNTACGLHRKAYLDMNGEEHPEMLAACLHDQSDEDNPGIKWHSDVLARRMKMLSDFYGGAMAVIEENNFGGGVIIACQHLGLPLWRRTKTNDMDRNKTTRIVGYSTSETTREWWVQACQRAIRDQSYICRYKPATDEFQWFVTLPSGRSEAVQGRHDDQVTMIGMGLVVRCYKTMPAPIERAGFGFGDQGRTAWGQAGFGASPNGECG